MSAAYFYELKKITLPEEETPISGDIFRDFFFQTFGTCPTLFLSIISQMLARLKEEKSTCFFLADTFSMQWNEDP